MLGHFLSGYPEYVRFFFAGELWVGVFFFYSAYGLRTSYITKEKYLNHFVLKKVVQIYIPFFIAETVYTISSCFIGSIKITKLSDFLLRCSGLKLSNSTLWYVVEILIIYLLFYIWFRFIVKKAEKRYLKSDVFFAFAYVIFLIYAAAMNLGTWWFISTFAFIMGFWYAGYKKRGMSCINPKITVILKFVIIVEFLAVYFLVKLLDYFGMRFWKIPTTYVITALQMIAVPLFILCLYMLSQNMMIRKLFKSKIMQFIGRISYEIYLWHMFVTMILNNIVKEHTILITIISIIFTILLSCIANRINSKIKEVVTYRNNINSIIPDR